MQIEYFRLIDRIIALDLAARTIQVEAIVPAESTIFEGHFPGHPLMPGVLLQEAMNQASGWLIIGITKFTCMPFFAAVKEAKFRSFVTPGMALTVNATLEHEGSGYAVTRAEIRARAQDRNQDNQDKLICNAEITFRLVPFPSPHFRENMEKFAATISFPMELAANG
ncbi:MAG: beta-hydroxyacyl-ACP dehydratase [Rhizobiales bacterium]|nr:beta-hydroxyacyl-ACP dehydratase [Hyphomicrobiales bacterium]